MATDPLLQALEKRVAVPGTTTDTQSPGSDVASIPQPKNPEEIQAVKGVLNSPGFYTLPPDQRRAKLKAVPAFSQVNDSLLNSFIDDSQALSQQQEPGVLSKVWEFANSPVKSLTGKSLQERYAESAGSFKNGAQGKIIDDAAKAGRDIQDAGGVTAFGDPETNFTLQALANPDTRAFAHRVAEHAVGLAESPLTYMGVGEGAVAAGSKLAGLASKTATGAKVLKGVQLAQKGSSIAFQAQALAAIPESLKGYFDNPSPETAADVLFAAGLGGTVGAHITSKLNGSYKAGGTPERVLERARVIAKQQYNVPLEGMTDTGGSQLHSILQQAVKDVGAGVAGAEPTGLGKLKARQEQAAAKKTAPPPDDGSFPQTPLPVSQTPPNVGTGKVRVPDDYQAEPEGPGTALATQGDIIDANPRPQTGLQPANQQANQSQGFTMGEDQQPAATQRPPGLRQITGEVTDPDAPIQQPAGAPPPLQLGPGGAPGGQLVTQRPGPLVSTAPIDVPPIETGLQPANPEANQEQGYTRPGFQQPAATQRPWGPKQIEGAIGQPAFTTASGDLGPDIGKTATPPPPMDAVPPPPAPPQSATESIATVHGIVQELHSEEYRKALKAEQDPESDTKKNAIVNAWVDKKTGEIIAFGNYSEVDKKITSDPRYTDISFSHKYEDGYKNDGRHHEFEPIGPGLEPKAVSNLDAAVAMAREAGKADPAPLPAAERAAIDRDGEAKALIARREQEKLDAAAVKKSTADKSSGSEKPKEAAAETPAEAEIPAEAAPVAAPAEAPVAAASAPTPEAPHGYGEDGKRIWKKGDPIPPNDEVVNINPHDLIPDPGRFQYKLKAIGKGGTDDRFREAKKYNYNMGGAIVAWIDPETGIPHPTNGHHRTQIGQSTNAAHINVRFSEAKTWQEARAEGALINIGEGNGTAIDAAKLFRDRGLKPEDLGQYDILPNSKIAIQGMKLANLAPHIFARVVDERMTPSRGALLGELIPNDHVAQQAALDFFDHMEKNGKGVDNDEARDIIEQVLAAPEEEVGGEQEEMFPVDKLKKRLVLERAQVSAAIGKRLSKERSLFALVNKEGNAGRLEAAGNILNADANEKIAQEAALVAGVYGHLKNVHGGVAAALDEAAREVAQGISLQTAIGRAYERVKTAVAAELGRKPGPGEAGQPLAAAEPGEADPNGNSEGLENQGPDLFGNSEGPAVSPPAPGPKDEPSLQRAAGGTDEDLPSLQRNVKRQEDSWISPVGKHVPMSDRVGHAEFAVKQTGLKASQAQHQMLKDGWIRQSGDALEVYNPNNPHLPAAFDKALAESTDGVVNVDVGPPGKTAGTFVPEDQKSDFLADPWGYTKRKQDAYARLNSDKPSLQRTDKPPGINERADQPVKIDRGPVLFDKVAQSVRESTVSKVEAAPEPYLSEYTKRFGNVLNADNAATLFEEYNSDRAKYREAVHPAAQWIRDELFRRALAEPDKKGNDRVVFTAGGNAAGKSTAVAAAGVNGEAQVVLDSTFSNPEHAKGLVQMALDAGKTVSVIHVDRPLNEALKAMIERSRQEGRVVTLSQLIGSQRGAAETVHSLWSEYQNNSDVRFKFLSNTPDGVEVRAGAGDVRPVDYNKSREALNGILDEEYRAGRITEENYRRIKGGAQSPQPTVTGSGNLPDSGGAEPPGQAESGDSEAVDKPTLERRTKRPPGTESQAPAKRTAKPPNGDLFSPEENQVIGDSAAKDKDKLLGERLTAHFNSEIGAQENAGKLKKKPAQQEDFFTALPEDKQNKLFLRGMDKPLQVDAAGKGDIGAAIADMTHRVYPATANRPARVYLDPSAKHIVHSAGVSVGMFKQSDNWSGAALKTRWVDKIAGELRGAVTIDGHAVTPEESYKLHALADSLDEATASSPQGVSVIDARQGFSDIKAAQRHENAHIDQLAVDDEANYKIDALMDKNKGRVLGANPDFVTARDTLIKRGYKINQTPTEILSHIAGGLVDPATGHVRGLGITPEAAMEVYADILEAVIEKHGDTKAYSLINNAKLSTQSAVRGIIDARNQSRAGAKTQPPVPSPGP